MDLSIIIVNYNTAALTRECIKSIRDSKPKMNYEIILIDNGSQEKLPIGGYKDVTVINNSENFGFAKANNQGISASKGKYVLLLNSDTIIKGKAIDALYEFARQSKGVGVVGAKLLNKDGTMQDSVFHFPTIVNAIRQYWLGDKDRFGLYVPKVCSPVEVDAVVGAALLITPKALQKVGMLDDSYFFYFEDVDYCRKVWKAGLTACYLPEAEVIHLKGASGGKIATAANQWKRLIPSSKIYHGLIEYYILFAVIWLSQKWEKIFK